MLEILKEGGPAFPTEPNTQPGFYRHHGMSLRDWFAGQALAGIGTWVPAGGGEYLSTHQAIEVRAQWAYAQADAMLAAREPK